MAAITTAQAAVAVGALLLLLLLTLVVLTLVMVERHHLFHPRPRLTPMTRVKPMTLGELHSLDPTGGVVVAIPCNGPVLYPPETCVLVRKDQSFAFQMHYTTSGKPTRDVTRFGLYFHEQPPKYLFRTAVLFKPSLMIPANTKEYSDSIAQDFPHEVLLFRLTPHAHFRGRASRFVAQYPDGREELLLSVPKYDFNWQTTYTLATPKQIPAGTRIVHTTVYDNSAQNPANPDPNRVVPWGDQSFDEMLYGVVQYRDLTPIGG